MWVFGWTPSDLMLGSSDISIIEDHERHSIEIQMEESKSVNQIILQKKYVDEIQQIMNRSVEDYLDAHVLKNVFNSFREYSTIRDVEIQRTVHSQFLNFIKNITELYKRDDVLCKYNDLEFLKSFEEFLNGHNILFKQAYDQFLLNIMKKIKGTERREVISQIRFLSMRIQMYNPLRREEISKLLMDVYKTLPDEYFKNFTYDYTHKYFGESSNEVRFLPIYAFRIWPENPEIFELILDGKIIDHTEILELIIQNKIDKEDVDLDDLFGLLDLLKEKGICYTIRGEKLDSLFDAISKKTLNKGDFICKLLEYAEPYSIDQFIKIKEMIKNNADGIKKSHYTIAAAVLLDLLERLYNIINRSRDLSDIAFAYYNLDDVTNMILTLDPNMKKDLVRVYVDLLRSAQSFKAMVSRFYSENKNIVFDITLQNYYSNYIQEIINRILDIPTRDGFDAIKNFILNVRKGLGKDRCFDFDKKNLSNLLRNFYIRCCENDRLVSYFSSHLLTENENPNFDFCLLPFERSSFLNDFRNLLRSEISLQTGEAFKRIGGPALTTVRSERNSLLLRSITFIVRNPKTHEQTYFVIPGEIDNLIKEYLNPRDILNLRLARTSANLEREKTLKLCSRIEEE
jgi:hypothetical protein